MVNLFNFIIAIKVKKVKIVLGEIVMNDKEISEIKRQINSLPPGNITIKHINGEEYEYWQYRDNNKQVTKRVKGVELDILRKQINERKRLESLLRSEMSVAIAPAVAGEAAVGSSFVSDFYSFVRFGNELKLFSEPVKGYKKRDCFTELENYLYSSVNDRVLILYGLRRTGKTTMIRQAVHEMDDGRIKQTAFVQIKPGDKVERIYKDLRELERRGIKYVFIEEVTLMDDFIEQAALFSDIFASSGMKIVLSGTDSLGFLFSQDEQLYDRAIMVHTTFIPYREFERVLGIQGIDNYIKYGGTMSMGGVDYNENQMTFSNSKKTNEYVDSAIARNIQHSLKNYQHSGHFRGLTDLYEKGELTNVINRIVEDMNHRFVVDVIRRAFYSQDLGMAKANLRRDRISPTDILDDIDIAEVTERLMSKLDIINASDQIVRINETHLKEIQEYLQLLDLIESIDVVSSSGEVNKQKRFAFTQPGLRYSQAESLISSLMEDEVFRDIGIEERMRISGRILGEVKGRMMEDIVLLETKKALSNKKVFALQFPIGEYDMVVSDQESMTCQLYEIKHSEKRVAEQARHLNDHEKCEYAKKQYGNIIRKAIVYNGMTCVDGEIEYINVEEYLNELV